MSKHFDAAVCVSNPINGDLDTGCQLDILRAQTFHAATCLEEFDHCKLSRRILMRVREIRVALLEADVNFRVVKQLIENIKEKAMGEEVLSALSPSQQVIKIVHDELIKILGSHESKLRFANEPPSVIHDRGPAGFGQDHLHRQTGALAFEERPPAA